MANVAQANSAAAPAVATTVAATKATDVDRKATAGVAEATESTVESMAKAPTTESKGFFAKVSGAINGFVGGVWSAVKSFFAYIFCCNKKDAQPTDAEKQITEARAGKEEIVGQIKELSDNMAAKNGEIEAVAKLKTETLMSKASNGMFARFGKSEHSSRSWFSPVVWARAVMNIFGRRNMVAIGKAEAQRHPALVVAQLQAPLRKELHAMEVSMADRTVALEQVDAKIKEMEAPEEEATEEVAAAVVAEGATVEEAK